mgnify:CR=1 FL=1
MIIRMTHVRAARMCSSGTRKFFMQHGLDWGDFLKNGIEASIIEQIDDAMAREVLRVARG